MKPGDKVICIDDSKNPNLDYSMFSQWIREGEKYVVRRVETGDRVLLEEIKNPSHHFPALFGNAEPGFSKKRFADYEQYILGNVKEEENELHTM